ncbi:MAG TPA: hypothetical protein VMZ03_11290 [Chitinophagaceae bacterium]|nr:hypothetical protein [Chitinophagaceae bacterium]
MRVNQFLSKRSILLLVPAMLSVVYFLGITSCNSKKEKGTEEGTELKVSSDASCLILTASQLNTWFPKYTRPTNPEKDKIVVLKFYASIVPGTDALQVVVRGFNYLDAPVASSLTLGTGVYCAVVLPPYLIGQSFDVTLSDLNIIDQATGKLVDGFNQMILRPAVFKDGGVGADLLKFDAEIYVANAPVQEAYILPCPPCQFCRPKCDTAITGDTIPTPVTRDTAGKRVQ